MLSPELEKTREWIEQYVQDSQHEVLMTEHILLGLTHNESAKVVLIGLEADIESIQGRLQYYFDKYVERQPLSSDGISYSLASERVFKRAVIHLQQSGQNRLVEGADLLVSLLGERDSYAAQVLNEHGISRLKVLRYLSHNIIKQTETTEPDLSQDSEKSPKKPKTSPLQEFAQNLNERVMNGKIDPLIGRENEIERVAQILCRRRKNNPLLVGDPGVGKTAIAEGLAWLIVQGKSIDALKEATIYSLDMGALVAGTKFRGEFEARIKELLEAIKEKPNAILFIDEIHTVIGAGAASQGTLDVSNLIKPALANGELRCIGSTTFSEYRHVFEKDSALSRRFQKIDIIEPSIEDTIAILQGLKSKYEDYHGVSYTDDALKSAAELSAKHIHERQLPDKAIDVIDEAGARWRLTKAESNVIDTTMIETIVANIARIPPKTVSKDELDSLKTLENDLKRMVFGQDEAVKRLSDVITLSKAGLKSTEKPIGSFMFAGPTGVGKTEIAKQLAFGLGVPLIRFDMSEYMEAHTVSRLIGSPPGYVGHDKGGLLTDKVQQTPYCVLLLDELEKAHPDVFNILLQIMDYGKLTDNNGREVLFRQVILIMTTNVGAENISRASMGFTHQDHTGDNVEAMKKVFSPEFRNRLDATVQFSPLDERAIAKVVDKFLLQLQEMLDDKQVIMTVSDNARSYLAKKGYDKSMGARPMARLIDDELKKPLAHELLFGVLVGGGSVLVDVVEDRLVLSFE